MKPLFERAIELLEDSETVTSFAPVGLWAVDDRRGKWLDTFSRSSDKKRTFIAGLCPDPELEKKVEDRIRVLLDGNVDVYTIEPQKHFRLGIIMYDKKILVGTSSKNAKEFPYFETDDDKVYTVFNCLLNDITASAQKA